ncbi:MAG: tyrosine-type recombinase/integrase [Roseiarcus sp.]|jgi:site-specific recombinase XerD
MKSDPEPTDLVILEPGAPPIAGDASRPVPAIVAATGDRATRRFLEFFAVTIENPNTREAYYRACRRFFAWCDARGLKELVDIEPMHVAAYIKSMGGAFEKPSVKQHLAAIRMLFDWLVVGQVVATNPAHSVRGPKHVVKRGKTPVLTADQARELLDSIDVSTVVGLRDRALIALMAYSFARVSAAVAMRVEDYFATGKRWWVRLHEKGGKRHEMPAHHNLEAYLDAYLHAAGITDAKKTPLFRSANWHSGALTDSAMHRVDVWRMVRRRAKGAGIDAEMCCHTFRATGITAYLDNSGTLENAQAMAAHESPRTTKLYDRTSDEITLDEVERIAI